MEKAKIYFNTCYYYTKVKAENIKPYTEAMGKATIVVGMTVILMAIVRMITYIPSYMGGLIFTLGLIVSTIMFYKAQKKYNKRVF